MPQIPGVPDHAAPQYEVISPTAIEPKTKAATIGAGAGSVVTGFVLYLLDAWLWNGEADPAVPLPVVLFVGLVVTGLCTFAGGYFARHVQRSSEQL